MEPHRTMLATLARRAVAWAVLVLAALVALRLAAGLLVGVVQTLVTLVLLAVLGMAVVWALRRR